MYLDDQMSGWRFENNTFDDCDTALFIGGGRSTVATGNTFSNCNLAVHLDNRGMNWEASQCKSPSGTSFKDVEAVLAGPAAKEWTARFPELLKIHAGDHLCVPVYNQIEGNTYDKGSVKKFIDASDADIAAWLDVVKDNTATYSAATAPEPTVDDDAARVAQLNADNPHATFAVEAIAPHNKGGCYHPSSATALSAAAARAQFSFTADELRAADGVVNIDWRDHGAVGPIQQQHPFGTCWAFSMTAVTEAISVIQGKNKFEKLSEQMTVSCVPATATGDNSDVSNRQITSMQ